MTNLQGGLASKILYYSIQARPQMFISDRNEIYIMLGSRDTSVTTPDTLYRVGMKFVGANVNENCHPQEYESQDEFYNFILGHCPDGIFGIHAARRVIYPNIYPGIDFHLYSNPWGPKFYLVMNPGSTPSNIKLQFQGQDSLGLDLIGQLKAYINDKTLTLPKGLCYQQINGQTVLVSAALEYAISPNTTDVGFAFGQYDPAYPLIVDISTSLDAAAGGGTDMEPEWCTFYGNTEVDLPSDATLLPNGGIVACGRTTSPAFPLYLAQYGLFDGSGEAFYSEFDHEYHRVYTTFFGGNGYDRAESIALSADANSVFLYGNTVSTNLPIQQFGTGFIDASGNGPSNGSCFIARFSREPLTLGHQQWITYFGQGIWSCNCIRVDAQDNVHILGTTDEFGNYPVPENTCQGTDGTFPICDPPGNGDYTQGTVSGRTDAFYAKFDNGSHLVHSTFFGGSDVDHGQGMEIDNSTGRVYFMGSTVSERIGSPTCQPTGSTGGFPLCEYPGGYFQQNLNGNNTSVFADAYIACFNTDGGLIWSTFAGSTADETGYHMGRGNNRDLYITGLTNATGYSNTTCAPPAGSGLPSCPTSGNEMHYSRSSATYDNYIMRFDGSTLALKWSTFIDAAVASLKPDEGSTMFMAMTTTAGSGGTTPLPTLPAQNIYNQPLHSDFNGIAKDAMVMAVNPQNELVYSSYFGGLGNDIGVQALPIVGGRVYLIGGSYSQALVPFHCPPTVDPYCYLSYMTQSPTTGEVLYAQLRYDATIGIDEIDADEEGSERLLIYPNPTSGDLSIELGSSWYKHGSPNMNIYDATGRMLYNAPWGIGTRSDAGFKIDQLGTGIRFIRIRSNDGTLDLTRPVVVE